MHPPERPLPVARGAVPGGTCASTSRRRAIASRTTAPQHRAPRRPGANCRRGQAHGLVRLVRLLADLLAQPLIDSASYRLAFELAPAVFATALLAAPGSASAATTPGNAFGICKQKVRDTFGEQARTRLKRIKERGNYLVEIKVTGVAGKPFSAKCEVARDGTLRSFAHDGPAPTK